jgi:putative Mg2+ transporter-C (MgtC) family protein
MSEVQVLGEVVLAIVLGGIVGFEREMADKPAGLRTHMLVAGAAAFLAGLAGALVAQYRGQESLVSADPIRIIEAVITGVSFLGAGTIIHLRGEKGVEGLTTAASLLFVAGLGLALAISQHILAIGATIIVVLVLRGLKMIEKQLVSQD